MWPSHLLLELNACVQLCNNTLCCIHCVFALNKQDSAWDNHTPQPTWHDISLIPLLHWHLLVLWPSPHYTISQFELVSSSLQPTPVTSPNQRGPCKRWSCQDHTTLPQNYKLKPYMYSAYCVLHMTLYYFSTCILGFSRQKAQPFLFFFLQLALGSLVYFTSELAWLLHCTGVYTKQCGWVISTSCHCSMQHTVWHSWPHDCSENKVCRQRSCVAWDILLSHLLWLSMAITPVPVKCSTWCDP